MLQTHPTLHPTPASNSSPSHPNNPHQHPSPATSNTKPNAKLWSAKHNASASSTKPLSWTATSHGQKTREQPRPKPTPCPSNDGLSTQPTRCTQGNKSYPSDRRCHQQYDTPCTTYPVPDTSASPHTHKSVTSIHKQPHHSSPLILVPTATTYPKQIASRRGFLFCGLPPDKLASQTVAPARQNTSANCPFLNFHLTLCSPIRLSISHNHS